MKACNLAKKLARFSGGKTESSRLLPFAAIQFPHPSIVPSIPDVAPCTLSCAPLAMPLTLSAMLLLLRPCEGVSLFLALAGDGLADLPWRISSFRGV